eukprot:SAG22_NODE_583_length_8878_cov_47.533546_8_plen_655_part_01
MGNLGRAVFPNSNYKWWPYSNSPQDKCSESKPNRIADSVENRRVNACGGVKFGMHGQRGSPEIDLAEVHPGNNRMSGWELCLGQPDQDECLAKHDKCEGEASYERLMDYGYCPSGSPAFDRDKTRCNPKLTASYQVSPGYPRWSYEEPNSGCFPVEGQWYEEMATIDSTVYGPNATLNKGWYGMDLSQNSFGKSKSGTADTILFEMSTLLGYTTLEMSEQEQRFWISYQKMKGTEDDTNKVQSLLDKFVVHWSGFFLAEYTGTYAFELTADDGVTFLIDGNFAAKAGIGTDGETYVDKTTGMATVLGKTKVSLALDQGWHQVLFKYYDDTGGTLLSVEYDFQPEGIGEERFEPIPGRLLCSESPAGDDSCRANGLRGDYYFLATKPPIPKLLSLPNVTGLTPAFSRIDMAEHLRTKFYTNGREIIGSYVYKESFQQATDGVSAMVNMEHDLFERQAIYRLEWKRGHDGYLIFVIDGKQQFRINASALRQDTELHYKDVNSAEHTYSSKGSKQGGTFHGSEIPNEPMYLLLNTDVSKRWGFESCPGFCECCNDCKNETCTTCFHPTKDPNKTINLRKWLADFCTTLPADHLIDYVRVWQKEGAASSVGCDPPEYPTKEWIHHHHEDYQLDKELAALDDNLPVMEEPLKYVNAGGSA